MPRVAHLQERVDFHLNRNRLFRVVDAMSFPNTANPSGNMGYPEQDFRVQEKGFSPWSHFWGNNSEFGGEEGGGNAHASCNLLLLRKHQICSLANCSYVRMCETKRQTSRQTSLW